ncbi:MAG: HAMP domain-containing sensor histidine kinase [Planctomycetaceae bacterium]|nr:HAMP domain-containing sensor histidine kinase [Planctomycetaceae bacterium]
MQLADFIVENVEPILVEWEAFARGITPGEKMDALALRDHAGEILLATVADMRSVQSSAERSARSRGHRRESDGASLNGASEQHAIGRLGSGFDLLELVSEYRALRASVLRLWHESESPPHHRDIDDVTRFNESIDQSLAKAVSSYTKRVDQSRDLFLAILSHDLRNPLNSIAMSASLLPHLVQPATEAVHVASQISTDAQVMARMISDLLDYTRTRLGAGMPVSPTSMDLGTLCQELHNEFQSGHPKRHIDLHLEGDLRGRWDADRLRQVISNLLGNAIQHSPENAPVALTIRGETSDIVLTVFNGGPPIPPGELSKIFDPLVRGSSAEHPKANRPGSIGLGLYIAREIAESHGGTITVTSSQASGTSFTVRLPREFVLHSGQPILDEQHLQTM